MESAPDPSPTLELPLAGIKVLDLTRVLAGPYGTMALADLGADVLKIESPAGDETRSWGPPFVDGESAYFLALNRNKRSAVLNLDNPADAKKLLDLAVRTDVLIENFRPGRMKRWGLGPEKLMELNPGLVFCSITGFGETGPYRDYPGFDPVIEAMSGFMSINGPPDRFEPYKAGVAIIDVLAGLHAVNLVTSLLVRRTSTGIGGHVSVSLFDVAVASLVNVMSSFLVSGELPERHGNDHPNIVPFGAFQASDGLLMICVGNDRQWQSLCDALGIPVEEFPGLTNNPQRVEKREQVRSLLEERLGQSTASEWADELMRSGVPAGEVRQLDQVINDQHVIANHLVQSIEHPEVGNIRLVGPPFLVDGKRPDISIAPPILGSGQGHIQDWLDGPAMESFASEEDHTGGA